MALQKTLPTPYGDASYHLVYLVSSQHLPEKITRVVVHSYRDEAHRQSEFALPLRVSENLLTGDDALNAAPEQWPAAYAWLKANNPDFADAVDA